MAQRRSEAAHGTDSGYNAHRRRWDSVPCPECRAAHSEYTARKSMERRRSAGIMPQTRESRRVAQMFKPGELHVEWVRGRNGLMIAKQ